jgi:hypothetical protein
VLRVLKPLGIHAAVKALAAQTNVLMLVLTVVAPTGIEPPHVTPTSVEYHQRFVIPKDRVPSKVTIFEAAKTVEVNAK